LSEKFDSAFKHVRGKARISEENIEQTLKEVRTALLEADVNFKVAKEFVAKVKEKALGEKVIRGVDPGEQFVKIMHTELTAMMGESDVNFDFDKSPLVILVCGLNGAGKTTFSGKLALWLRNKDKKEALLVPADNFRPAAKDQLITLAKNINVDYFDSDLALHPKDIAKMGIEEAKRQGKDVVIIDTAGRLHVDDELMGQLKEVKEEVASLSPEVLLVADAMTGQEAVNVAKTFHETMGLTGTVLSKMDSDAKGGAALSIRYSTGVPIRFLSVGEGMKDLEIFYPDRLAGRILDMGDVVSLVEKAQEHIDEKEAEKVMKKIEKNQFSIDDFIKQMDTMNKLGSMGDLMKMIPGMGGMMRQMGDLSVAETEMKKMRTLISSMTKQEKKDHTVFNDSRKKRVAMGAGAQVKDVTEFLKKFEQMRSMMSGMMGMMKGGMPGGMEGLMGGGGNLPGQMPAKKGFRQAPAFGGKKRKKGKRKGPW